MNLLQKKRRFAQVFALALLLVSSLLFAQVNNEGEVLDVLKKDLEILFEAEVKVIPDELQREIRRATSIADLNRLSPESDKWLREKFGQLGNDKTSASFSEIRAIRTSGDAYLIMRNSFWRWLNNKPMELEGGVIDVDLYWKENDWPEIAIAPLGRGKVDWLWKLEVSTRPHGVIHVGMNKDSRRFLCYEYGIGLYYPEGATLERIRKEIVQTKRYSQSR